MAVCCSYSYSEVISGVTSNAAAGGLTWTMPNVLPAEAGLTVNGVLYRYTTNKNPSDPMTVSIENKNALGSGLIFQRQDDWSGLPGNTIVRSVPVSNIPLQYWGDGSINVQGQGTVSNASVVYNYTYDTCYDPLKDPSCPGYADAMAKFLASLPKADIQVSDPLNDEFVKKSMEAKAKLETEDEQKKKELKEAKKDDDKKKEGLETAKSAVENALLSAAAIEQANALIALNNIPKFEAYSVAMPGGVYNDPIRYVDKKLPDSRMGLRNSWAQQLKHNQMVDLQYAR